MIRIAIIGAGASGLTSATAALAEGMIPCIFEMSNRIGGVWGPDLRAPSDQGSAWPGMKVNISRHTGTFSNFNWPQNTPDFPTTQQVYDYLHDYAEYFELFPYIRFGCRVIEVLECDGKWLIRWQEDKTTLKEELFDSIIIATSKFTNPYTPNFNGLEQFKGKKLHSAQYKSAEEFINKRVLIVGGSLSGTSIAEDVAKKTDVIHLFRKERWVIKRYRSSDPQNHGPFLPRDLLKTYESVQVSLSKEEQYQLMLQHCSEQNEFPEWYMSPSSPVGFVVADEYFQEVRSGKLKLIRGEIDHFLNSSVVLEDGRSINDFDVVIFCTGYERDLSFLPEQLRLKPTTTLYEDTFPIDAKNLAYIGMYPGARGAVFPLVELQARYACGVFSGRLKLPSIETMKEEIANTPKDRDEIKFSTSLAQKLEVIPQLNSYHWSIRRMLLGAYTPARFRLEGFHSDSKAALKSIEETECYRRRLLRAHDKIPTLASMCLFKVHQYKKQQEESLEKGDTCSCICHNPN